MKHRYRKKPDFGPEDWEEIQILTFLSSKIQGQGEKNFLPFDHYKGCIVLLP